MALTPRKPIPPSLIDPKVRARFMAKVDSSGHCHQWTGAVNEYGYGRFKLPDGRHRYAHRVAWVIASGADIPAGLEIDHLCCNRACVNPEYMEMVTRRTNCIRAARRAA